MKAKTKQIWQVITATVAGLIIFLATLIPVARFLYEISICYYPQGSCWGPMGGPLVDKGSTYFIFSALMLTYLWVIIFLARKFYSLIK